jgi:DNA-directed RNA polymerase specialized sigma24 family protein
MRRTQAELNRRWAEKKVLDPEWEEIARRFEAGETAKRLAFIYGKKLATLRTVLGRLGLRHQRITPDLKEMIRLYEGGCSLEEIARLFECSKQNVSLRLRLRTRMRPRGKTGCPGWPEMIARGEW